jgi:hypothetical protein
LSFGIGAGLGVGAVSPFNTVRDIRRKLGELRSRPGASSDARSLGRLFQPPNDARGDYPIWAALVIYALTALAVVGLCLALLPRTPGIVFFLVFFTFVYSPFISYVNARLLGMQGQTVPSSCRSSRKAHFYSPAPRAFQSGSHRYRSSTMPGQRSRFARTSLPVFASGRS